MPPAQVTMAGLCAAVAVLGPPGPQVRKKDSGSIWVHLRSPERVRNVNDSSVSSRELSFVAWDTLGALCSFVPTAFLGRTWSLGTAGEEPPVLPGFRAQLQPRRQPPWSVWPGAAWARLGTGTPALLDPLHPSSAHALHHFHTQPSRVKRCVTLGQRRGEFPLPDPHSNLCRLTAPPSSPTRLRIGKDVLMDCNIYARAVTSQLGPFYRISGWEGPQRSQACLPLPTSPSQHL